jgi:tripartite-type tricarboxylate transporter receptor subunit TctC
MTTIRNEIAAFVKTPEISKRLSGLGIIPGGMTKEESEAVFRKDYEMYAAAIKAAGIGTPK